MIAALPEVLMRSMAALFLLLAVPARAQESKGQDLNQEKLETLVRELRPLIERETRSAFRKEPSIALSERKVLEEALAEDLAPLMRIQQPEASQEQIRGIVVQWASIYSSAVLGRYSPKAGSILVVPENFSKLAEMYKNPRLLSPDFLRVVILHEMVHALDQQAYEVFGRIAKAKSPEELEIWSALMEGHAQHVTHRILKASGENELFQAFEKQMLAAPPQMGEGEKYWASIVAQSQKFAYVDGKAFFDALTREGRKTYVEDVFKTPPSSKSVILKPATYYKPSIKPGVRRNLKPLWDDVRKQWGEEWTTRTQVFDESLVRTLFGDFVDSKLVSQVVEGLVFVEALSLTPKDSPMSKQVAVLVMQMSGKEAAAKCYDAELALLKAKDKRMKTGDIIIKTAEYSTLKLEEAVRNQVATKTVVAGTQEIVVRALIVESGAYVVEMDYIGQEIGDDELVKQARAVLEVLATEK